MSSFIQKIFQCELADLLNFLVLITMGSFLRPWGPCHLQHTVLPELQALTRMSLDTPGRLTTVQETVHSGTTQQQRPNVTFVARHLSIDGGSDMREAFAEYLPPKAFLFMEVMRKSHDLRGMNIRCPCRGQVDYLQIA